MVDPAAKAGASHEFRMDLPGRLRNTKVAVHDAFLPVFEAVVNSIHSTEERFGEEVATKGRIEVHVHRVQQHALVGVGRPPIEEIEAFTIVDNGVGFTDSNLKSFETADTDRKLSKGGKGIGRLTWLVVFSQAEILSSFEDSPGNIVERSFTFAPTATGISNFHERRLHRGAELKTHIRLIGTRSGYSAALRKGTEPIADRIFEHCFNYFVFERCPLVTVIDEGADGTSTAIVNDRRTGLAISNREPLRVAEHDLELFHVRQRHGAGRHHSGHLLANDRVVQTFGLSEVSDLRADQPVHSESGEPQVHHVYVSGAALDAAADNTRTHFTLPDGMPLIEAGGSLDLKTLREAVGAKVNQRLSAELEAERRETLRKVVTHIRTKQPEYARLLEQKPEQLARITWSESVQRVDEQLYRLKQGWEQEIRATQHEVEQKLVEETTDLRDIQEQLYRVVRETNLAGQDDLVRYVIKRRAVLHLLTRLTSRFQPALEEDIHKIIFPLRKTNGQVDYGEHNLWLVDDTLSFYEYIASDQRFDQNEAVEIPSRKRPDILAFKTGDPYQHISLIEFKKPDRPADENPVDQLVDYARLLRKGGEVDARGVTMPRIAKSVRIDSYAIVTLTPQMEEVLESGPGEMKSVEGEERWYGRVEALNMNVEVLHFAAFIRRAQQRNQAFFRALNLLPFS